MLDLRITTRVAPRGGAPFSLDVRVRTHVGSIVLWGPSGCGKTALLQTIAGLRRPDAGHIYLGDRALFDRRRCIDIPAHERRIGYVFQQTALFPHLSVFDNIAYGLPRRLAHRRDRVRELARRCEVADLLDRRTTHLSGGQAQRVAIARALAVRPTLLLLDEPLNALDPDLRAVLQATIVDYCRELQIPFVLVTHDRAEAERMGEAIVVMSAGRVLDVRDRFDAVLSDAPPDTRPRASFADSVPSQTPLD